MTYKTQQEWFLPQMHSIFKDIQLHGATAHFYVDTYMYGAWDNLHMLSKMAELKIVWSSRQKKQNNTSSVLTFPPTVTCHLFVDTRFTKAFCNYHATWLNNTVDNDLETSWVRFVTMLVGWKQTFSIYSVIEWNYTTSAIVDCSCMSRYCRGVALTSKTIIAQQ